MNEAYVRLEADLGLCNALSTAIAGRGPWPKFVEEQAVVKWRLGQVALPVIGALVFLMFGFALPIAPALAEFARNAALFLESPGFRGCGVGGGRCHR